METQFIDRILTCSDCHGEFVFTAGEQLFFHDKQFKNDPKRCKPCKSRRSGLSAAANGLGPAAAGLSRTETRTECSECGVQTTVPFKPTQGRPVLCRQCFQTKNRPGSQTPVPSPVPAPMAAIPGPVPVAPLPVAPLPVAPLPLVPAAPIPVATPATVAAAIPTEAQTLSALTEISTNSNGESISPDAAVVAMASMASASPDSSVASAADLASITDMEQTPAMLAPILPADLISSAIVDVAPSTLIPAEVGKA